MSAVKAVRHLLANNAGLTASVAATRIMAGPLSQGTTLPAIGITHVSTVRWQNVTGPTGMARSRVQVTVMANTYPSLRAVLDLVRAALPRSRGAVNGVNVDQVIPDTEGPDFADEESGIFIGSHDVSVVFTE